MLVRSAALLVAVGILAGCKPDYSGVDLELRSSPPAQVVVNSREVELPAGVSVIVSADLRSANRVEFDSSYTLDLFSLDRSVLRVESQQDRGRYVLIGVSPGTTCLDVVVDDSPQECIDVTVLGPR